MWWCCIKPEKEEEVVVKKEKKKDQFIFKFYLHSSPKSIVYVATDTNNNEIVVVKKIRKDALARSELEAELMQKLDHENIIKFYCSWSTPRQFFIVMEYVEGGDLFDYVADRDHLSEQDIKLVSIEILKGLKYLHSLNILHRDLKMENILVVDFPKIKLADFGLSKDNESNLRRRQSRTCGSTEYMAPEILLLEPYGLSADMWSFGIILYAMFTRCHLVNDMRTMEKQREKVLQIDFDSTKEIKSIDGRIFTYSFLMQNPDKRLTAEEALKTKYICD